MQALFPMFRLIPFLVLLAGCVAAPEPVERRVVQVKRCAPSEGWKEYRYKEHQ